MAVTHEEGGAGGGEVEGVGGSSVLQRGLKEEVLRQTTAVPGCTAHSDGGASPLSRRAVLGRLGFAWRRERERSGEGGQARTQLWSIVLSRSLPLRLACFCILEFSSLHSLQFVRNIDAKHSGDEYGALLDSVMTQCRV